jgi:hypothetical protein
MFIGFGCAQLLYGTITHGGSFFSDQSSPIASWLFLVVLSFCAAFGGWWLSRLGADKHA